MVRELRERLSELEDPVKTIYFGGGTPSLLSKKELQGFLDVFNPHTLVEEITLEVNPEDLTHDNLTDWESLGINRLSIGIQSLNETLLHWMNRNHTAQDVLTNLKLLDNFSFNCSIDLIYGVPNQTLQDLELMAALTEKTFIHHVSAYALTLENKTLLSHTEKKSGAPLINEHQQVEHYFEVQQRLIERGFEQYEVSNYARNKAYALHNKNYWKGFPYLGIGPGAHSYNGKYIRRWNVANNAQYIKQSDWFDTEELTDENRWNELWLTGLRTMEGVSQDSLEQFGNLRTQEKREIELLIKNGDLTHQNNIYRLTKNGFLKADRLSSLLFRV
jgi:oxygen-independent coproporphyrinogen-3 oxidase